MKDENNDVFIRAVCGALGSVISMTLLYPLETLRTRLQLDPTLLNTKTTTSKSSNQSSLFLLYFLYKEANNNILALYRGWTSLVLALSVTNFVYFYSFHFLRRQHHILFTNSNNEQQEVYFSTDFICGVIAGIITVLISNPFWVVNIRLKLQGKAIKKEKKNDEATVTRNYYNGILHCFFTIIEKEGGMLSLWSGATSSLLLVFNPTIQFATYEALKRWNWLNTLLPFLIIGPTFYHAINSVIAKIIATVLTYPLQVIQTRSSAGGGYKMKKKQTLSFNNDRMINSKNTSMLMIMILKLQNVNIILRDLFSGLESKLLQTSLTAAIMFLIYEKLIIVVKTILE